VKRAAIITLKLVASVPLALIFGGIGARIIENGLWPLLLLPDRALPVVDGIATIIMNIVVFVALLWGWVLDRA
jgi:hypothetical protein